MKSASFNAASTTTLLQAPITQPTLKKSIVSQKHIDVPQKLTPPPVAVIRGKTSTLQPVKTQARPLSSRPSILKKPSRVTVQSPTAVQDSIPVAPEPPPTINDRSDSQLSQTSIGDKLPANLNLVERVMARDSFGAIAADVEKLDPLIMEHEHSKKVKQLVDMKVDGIADFMQYTPLNYVVISYKLESELEKINVPLLAGKYKAYALAGCMLLEIALSKLPEIKELVKMVSADAAEKIPSFMIGLSVAGLTELMDTIIEMFLKDTFTQLAQVNYRASRKTAMAEDFGLGIAPQHNAWMWVILTMIACILCNSFNISAKNALAGIREVQNIMKEDVKFSAIGLTGYAKRIYDAFKGQIPATPTPATTTSTTASAPSGSAPSGSQTLLQATGRVQSMDADSDF